MISVLHRSLTVLAVLLSLCLSGCDGGNDGGEAPPGEGATAVEGDGDGNGEDRDGNGDAGVNAMSYNGVNYGFDGARLLYFGRAGDAYNFDVCLYGGDFDNGAPEYVLVVETYHSSAAFGTGNFPFSERPMPGTFSSGYFSKGGSHVSIKGGSVNISYSGGRYVIEADCSSSEGKPLKAYYKGQALAVDESGE